MKGGSKQGKKSHGGFGKRKKSPADIKKKRGFSLLFNKKIGFLAILVILISVAAVLSGLIDFPGISGEKAPAEEKAGNTQEDQLMAEKAEAAASDLGELENHRASDFIKVLRGDKYLIRYRTTTVYNGEAFEAETAYAVSGASTAMISGDRATIVSSDEVHMVNHTDKTMLIWDVTQEDSLKRIDTMGLVYLGSSEAGGLFWEEYATETTRFKFYFKENKLVKLVTRINGLDTVMDIVEVSEEVPEDLFTIPADYQTTRLQ